MRVAVVGSGIAGMGAAWLLSESADTHVFEIEPRMGGHSHTVTADTAEGLCLLIRVSLFSTITIIPICRAV